MPRGESGGMIEQYLGGESIRPQNDTSLVDALAKSGELIGQRFANNQRYAEQIKQLPSAIKELLKLTDMHAKSVDQHQQEAIRSQMFKIKKRFDHNLLLEALTRYTINAHPDDYMPWAPIPLSKKALKRNDWIADLHESICEELNTEDYDKVRFFSATQTPVDLMYSTDGFFVMHGSLFPDGQRRILPVDITISRNKKNLLQNPSGSLVLYMDVLDLDDDRLDLYREEFAKKIISAIKLNEPDHSLDGFKSKFDK